VKRLLHAARSAAALLVLALLVPHGVRAQEAPEMQELALAWAHGNYIGPVICSLPGGPMRVARKASITPPRRRRPRLAFLLEVEPMGTGEATCTNGLGEPEPELRAKASIYYDGPSRRDTARRDLQQMLRRERAVSFRVESGQLRIGTGDGARAVSLKDATLEVRLIGAGSDAARMLGDVGKLAKRSLLLEARDGTRVVMHAVHVIPRK
jgi:hypothetical protein